MKIILDILLAIMMNIVSSYIYKRLDSESDDN